MVDQPRKQLREQKGKLCPELRGNPEEYLPKSRQPETPSEIPHSRSHNQGSDEILFSPQGVVGVSLPSPHPKGWGEGPQKYPPPRGHHGPVSSGRAFPGEPVQLSEESAVKEDQRHLSSSSWEWKQVLYVSFGFQVEILLEQLEVIKVGLEESEVNFLWVIRTNESELHDDGFDDRVKNMGLLVPEWIDQRKILSHQSMKGFKIGVRVESCNGHRFLFHGCFVINVDCMATTATEGGIADLTTRWGDMVLEDEALEFELLGDAMGVAQDGEEETWPFLD
nr:UDP-glycosyltransferase 90A1-like [Ipomoea batatas]